MTVPGGTDYKHGNGNEDGEKVRCGKLKICLVLL